MHWSGHDYLCAFSALCKKLPTVSNFAVRTSLLAENVTPSYFSSLLSPLGGASMNTGKKKKWEAEEKSEEEIEKEKRNKKEKIKKKKNEKGMQFLEGNSCEPLLQRPLACFLNYLGILSFLCFTYSPLVSLQPRLNNQLILDGIVVRMVESQIDDIFHEIFVLFNCSSFLKKKIIIQISEWILWTNTYSSKVCKANKILVCFLIHMCYGLGVKMIIVFAYTPIFKVLLILGLE